MIVLKEGWPIKEMRELSWDFGSYFGKKNVLALKDFSEKEFTFEDGTDKISKIKKVLLWSKNVLVMDTGEDFYYTCHFIPKKLIKKLKNQEFIDVMVENEYNGIITHYVENFKCHF